jgi:hypothetical protein
MSDTPATESLDPEIAAAVTAPEDPFSDTDKSGFENDDIIAGQAITKMLSVLFIYTLIAMSIVSLWTVAASH